MVSQLKRIQVHKKKLNSSQHQATHAQRTVGSEKKIRKNVAFPEVTDIQLFIPK